MNDLRTRVLGDITARRATTNCSWVVKVVGRVNTSKQVDAIIAVEELSNFIEIRPTENPAGGGLLEPVT